MADIKNAVINARRSVNLSVMNLSAFLGIVANFTPIPTDIAAVKLEVVNALGLWFTAGEFDDLAYAFANVDSLHSALDDAESWLTDTAYDPLWAYITAYIDVIDLLS